MQKSSANQGLYHKRIERIELEPKLVPDQGLDWRGSCASEQIFKDTLVLLARLVLVPWCLLVSRGLWTEPSRHLRGDTSINSVNSYSITSINSAGQKKLTIYSVVVYWKIVPSLQNTTANCGTAHSLARSCNTETAAKFLNLTQKQAPLWWAQGHLIIRHGFRHQK